VNVPAATLAADVAIFRNAQGAMDISGGAGRIVGQFELGLVYDINDGLVRPMTAVGIGPNVARVTGAAAFPANGAWHHLAFSADGAQLRLYVDGQQAGSIDYLARINAPDIPYISIGARLNLDTSDPPVLGPETANPNWMVGLLDDIGLWTRALTADEVAKIYQAGQQGQALNTVVITPPVQVEFTGITVGAGGAITLTWTGGGTLQVRSDLGSGQWQDLTGAASPYTFTPQAGQPVLFGRIRQ